MCPACWATLLASYGALLAISAATVAGTDRWALLLSGVLGAMSWLHIAGEVSVPWWCFALVGATLVARIGGLMMRGRDELLAARAWRMARSIASRRCPTKSLPRYGKDR